MREFSQRKGAPERGEERVLWRGCYHVGDNL